MKKLIWFAIAGTVGFAVDSGVLYLMMWVFGLGPFVARIIAIAAAMTCTWIINRTRTFGRSERSIAGEGLRYGSVGLASSAVNYAVYSGVLLLIPRTPPFMALVAGSFVATLFSYFGYSRLVFRR